MPTPIVEDIVADFVAAVATVTTANGYNQNLAVQRLSAVTAISRQDYSTVIVQQSLSRVENEPTDFAEYNLSISVTVTIVTPEGSSDVSDTKMNQAMADIIKAVMVDPFRNDCAIDTRHTDTDYVHDADSKNGLTEAVELTFDIHFRHRQDDPYTG